MSWRDTTHWTLFGSAVAFVASGCLYFLTAAPTVGLGDTALFLDSIRRFTISTFVNAHNISLLIGSLFEGLPLDNPFYKATLASVFVGSDPAKQPSTVFERQDQIAARATFDRNPLPFPVTFEWIAPSGQVALAAKPFMVPAGQEAVSSRFNLAEPVEPVQWRVRVSSDEKWLAEETFEIR